VDTVLGHVLTWPFLFVAKAIVEGSTTKVFDKGHMNLDLSYINDIINGIEILVENPPKREEKKPIEFQTLEKEVQDLWEPLSRRLKIVLDKKLKKNIYLCKMLMYLKSGMMFTKLKSKAKQVKLLLKMEFQKL